MASIFLWRSLFHLFLRQLNSMQNVDIVLRLLIPKQFTHLTHKDSLPLLAHLLYLLIKKCSLGVSSLVLNNVLDSGVAICVCQGSTEGALRIKLATFRIFICCRQAIGCPITNWDQSHARHFDKAVVDELEFFSWRNAALPVIAFWRDPVGDKLIPLLVRPTTGGDARHLF